MAGLLSANLAGCVFLDPYVNSDSAENEFTQSPTYTNALAYARSQKDAYHDAISNHAILNSGVGTILIPLVAWATYQGFTSTNSGQLIGAGIIGGGLYGLSQFHYSPPRQRVYAAGISAIDCTLKAMTSMTLAYSDGETYDALALTSGSALDTFKTAAGALETKILQIKNQDEVAPFIVNELTAARKTLADAKTKAAKGDSARRDLNRAPQQLYFAVREIRSVVDSELMKTEPDLQVLVASLGQTIPISAGRLLDRDFSTLALPHSQAANGAEVYDKGKDDTPEQDEDKTKTALAELRDALDTLRNAEIPLEDALETATMAPSAEVLAKCKVDPSESGLLFAVNPSGLIEIDPSKTPLLQFETANGRFPYHAHWKGIAPSAEDATLEVQLLGTGQGLVQVDFAKAPAPGPYTLVVQDSNKGRTEVIIQVAGTKTTAGAGNSSNDTEVFTCKLDDWKDKTPLTDGAKDAAGFDETTFRALQSQIEAFAALLDKPENCSKGETVIAVDGTPGPIITTYVIASLQKINCGTDPKSYKAADVSQALADIHENGKPIPSSCPL